MLCDRMSTERGLYMDLDMLGFFIFMDEQERKQQQEENEDETNE